MRSHPAARLAAALLLVSGTAAWAWDRRDVEAAGRYRQQERQRAERFRRGLRGGAPAVEAPPLEDLLLEDWAARAQRWSEALGREIGAALREALEGSGDR